MAWGAAPMGALVVLRGGGSPARQPLGAALQFPGEALVVETLFHWGRWETRVCQRYKPERGAVSLTGQQSRGPTRWTAPCSPGTWEVAGTKLRKVQL